MFLDGPRYWSIQQPAASMTCSAMIPGRSSSETQPSSAGVRQLSRTQRPAPTLDSRTDRGEAFEPQPLRLWAGPLQGAGAGGPGSGRAAVGLGARLQHRERPPGAPAHPAGSHARRPPGEHGPSDRAATRTALAVDMHPDWPSSQFKIADEFSRESLFSRTAVRFDCRSRPISRPVQL